MGRLSAVPSRLGGASVARIAPLRRGSARQRLYTTEWDKASKAFLAANPLCRGCKAMGRVAPATLTDHVVPHRGDQTRFWDRDGWQASCDWHHNVVKQRLEAEFEAGMIFDTDLWLDSASAIAVARRALREAGEGGAKTP